MSKNLIKSKDEKWGLDFNFKNQIDWRYGPYVVFIPIVGFSLNLGLSNRVFSNFGWFKKQREIFNETSYTLKSLSGYEWKSRANFVARYADTEV